MCGALTVACTDAFGPSLSTVDAIFAELDAVWISSTNPVSVSPGITHLTTRPAAAACGYQAVSETFVCPTRTQNGLTSATSFQILDAGNAPQPAFTANATASVRVVTDLNGTLSSIDGTTTTLTAHVDEILSGLMSGVHTLNGTATTTFVSSGVTPTTYSMVETTSNLVLATGDRNKPYPPSGTITTQIYTGAPVAAGLLSTVTSRFDGTRNVTLVIVTGSLTQTCTIDLKGTTVMVCV